ncbi:hypothetical protein [Micromonospora sp. NPDC047740]|uniref:hypothetical protein n=1 Tax=Micromonospora sp. NPDC047740 TaxID=3364254 RepID=UPI003723A058
MTGVVGPDQHSVRLGRLQPTLPSRDEAGQKLIDSAGSQRRIDVHVHRSRPPPMDGRDRVNTVDGRLMGLAPRPEPAGGASLGNTIAGASSAVVHKVSTKATSPSEYQRTRSAAVLPSAYDADVSWPVSPRRLAPPTGI